MISFGCDAQEKLAVVHDIQAYRQSSKLDSTNEMIELKALIPSIIYDLRYATTNNFMQRRMYPAGTNKTFLRRKAALALSQVQDALRLQGLGLKVFDAYRPYAVSVAFWELVHDERYVANPAKGSGHNRGIAVDLTLINLANGEELNMGTGFDNFSDTAHQDFVALPDSIIKNRSTLTALMQQHGFQPLRTEWWHFYYTDDKIYEVLDLPFNKLISERKKKGSLKKR